MDEEELRREPLDRRRERLRKLLKRSTGKEPAPGYPAQRPNPLASDGIFRHACQMGVEGIVWKRIDLRRRSAVQRMNSRRSTRYPIRSIETQPIVR